MSNSTYLTVRGTAYWAKVFPENKDATGFDDELKESGGQYTIMVDLDSDSLMELTKASSQVPDYPRVIKDEDGNDITAYRFKRLHEKRDRSGKLLEWASGNPAVVDAAGKIWDLEELGLIGNGSEVELRVCVYKAGRVVGTRLEEVKVVNHVPAPEREVA